MTAILLQTHVGDADLITAIEAALTDAGSPRTVRHLRREPWAYTSSFPLETITVTLAGGDTLRLILKHLSPRVAPEAMRRAKPAFVVDPQREIEVYRRLLVPLGIGPRLFGVGNKAEAQTYWLLMEHIAGREMYQIGSRGCWEAVAKWLAIFHQRTASFARESAGALRLIEYDAHWYTQWMDRALRFAGSSYERMRVEWLARRYSRVVDKLASLPATIIHGEFYPSNVLIGDASCGSEIYAIDWEMAARAPALIDLAALTVGWTDDDQHAIIAAYVGSADARHMSDVSETVEAVRYAQVASAVQWLGWFGRRKAPPAHAHDWLADALQLAETLKL